MSTTSNAVYSDIHCNQNCKIEVTVQAPILWIHISLNIFATVGRIHRGFSGMKSLNVSIWMFIGHLASSYRDVFVAYDFMSSEMKLAMLTIIPIPLYKTMIIIFMCTIHQVIYHLFWGCHTIIVFGIIAIGYATECKAAAVTL